MENLILLLIEFLNKNTSSIVVDYLTDLPKLPFNEQLLYKTRLIFVFLSYSTYYDGYFKVYNSRYNGKCGVKHTLSSTFTIGKK